MFFGEILFSYYQMAEFLDIIFREQLFPENPVKFSSDPVFLYGDNYFQIDFPRWIFLLFFVQ